MKVLMQNCVTGRFLGEGDVWRESADKARDFGSSPNAIAYYISLQLKDVPELKDVQVVLHFDYDPQLNIQLPLSAPRRNGKPVAQIGTSLKRKAPATRQPDRR